MTRKRTLHCTHRFYPCILKLKQSYSRGRCVRRCVGTPRPRVRWRHFTAPKELLAIRPTSDKDGAGAGRFRGERLM